MWYALASRKAPLSGWGLGVAERQHKVSADKSDQRMGYVADYAAAQRRSTRLAAEAIEADRQSNSFAAQGRALYQIKELARAGFLLLPEATDEQFEQLWHTAFQIADQGQKGSQK